MVIAGCLDATNYNASIVNSLVTITKLLMNHDLITSTKLLMNHVSACLHLILNAKMGQS